jgi:hypothetical protein
MVDPNGLRRCDLLSLTFQRFIEMALTGSTTVSVMRYAFAQRNGAQKR